MTRVVVHGDESACHIQPIKKEQAKRQSGVGDAGCLSSARGEHGLQLVNRHAIIERGRLKIERAPLLGFEALIPGGTGTEYARPNHR